MAQVKLILREDVDKLGRAGDVVSVKPGFARNYLLPKGMASLATEARVAELEHHRRVIAEDQARLLKSLEAVRQKLEALVLEVEAEAGEEGKLFGSVTMHHVADLLKEKGLELDRRKMHVSEPIKSVGEHVVEVRLAHELVASVRVLVSAAGGPAAAAPGEVGDEEAPVEPSGEAREDD